MATNKSPENVYIEEVKSQVIRCVLIGKTPLLVNRMPEKVKRILLLPKGRMTSADKQANLKHDPITEYRNSVYKISDEETLFGFPSNGIKGAMKTAALDLPGAKKTQIGRLVTVEDDFVHVYGIPELDMRVARQADINHTPDIRTRAIFPKWAAIVTISFVTPIMDLTSIINLLAAGGTTAGIGELRPEKGGGNYGKFIVRDENDPQLLELRSKGKAAQILALETPEFYNEESKELFDWYTTEILKKGK